MISLLESKNIDAFPSFPEYFQKQSEGDLEVYILSLKNAVIGYGILVFHSSHPPFAKMGIPEIKDLHAPAEYEDLLIQHIERVAKEKGYSVIGRNYSTKCLNERLIRFCTKYVPGKLLELPQILFGGALHHIWKIVTDQGEYVVKEINPQIVKKPNIVESYEFTEKVAYTFHLKGVPAVAAIKIDSHFAHNFEERLYILYPFVEGHVILPDQIDKARAQIVGLLFKTMHTCSPSFDLAVTEPHYDLFSDKCWSTLIGDSKDPRLLRLLPDIIQWNDRYQASIERLNKYCVISHRDLHYANILWDGFKPSIIDWESAGYTNPLQEILGYALEWSGIIQAHFRKEIFQAIFSTYQNTSNNVTSSEDAFFGWLGHSILGWTEFNIKRAFDKTLPLSEQTKGQSILNNTIIPCLTFIKEHMEELLGTLPKIRQ